MYDLISWYKKDLSLYGQQQARENYRVVWFGYAGLRFAADFPPVAFDRLSPSALQSHLHVMGLPPPIQVASPEPKVQDRGKEVSDESPVGQELGRRMAAMACQIHWLGLGIRTIQWPYNFPAGSQQFPRARTDFRPLDKIKVLAATCLMMIFRCTSDDAWKDCVRSMGNDDFDLVAHIRDRPRWMALEQIVLFLKPKWPPLFQLSYRNGCPILCFGFADEHIAEEVLPSINLLGDQYGIAGQPQDANLSALHRHIPPHKASHFQTMRNSLCDIIRRSELSNQDIVNTSKEHLRQLTDPDVVMTIRLLARFPQVVESCLMQELPDPHIFVDYLEQLLDHYDPDDLLDEEMTAALRRSWLVLFQSIRVVLQNGMWLLGVPA